MINTIITCDRCGLHKKVPTYEFEYTNSKHFCKKCFKLFKLFMKGV